MIPNDLQQIVSQHLSTQAGLHIHIGSRQHTWVRDAEPSLPSLQLESSPNPASESLPLLPLEKNERSFIQSH